MSAYELWKQGKWLSEGTVIFTLPKYFCYEDPHLTCRLEGDGVRGDSGCLRQECGDSE